MTESMLDEFVTIKDHPYRFDPTYGYSLSQLLAIGRPQEPEDFDLFWQSRYQRVRALKPVIECLELQREHDGWKVFDLRYLSTDKFPIGGWLLLPAKGEIQRGVIVGHGYGGRDAPDFDLPLTNAALLFPCFRGLSLSARKPLSADPQWHVLHNIDDPDNYVLGGCVDDIWMGITVLLELYPDLGEHIGLIGTSFGGGIGVIATAFDKRVKRAHFNVPTFGHQPLRLTLQTRGSGLAVRRFYRHHPEKVMRTLGFYDAATAAVRITVPTHFACARFDPAVAPPGQFAIYNAARGDKQLYVLDAGHHDYPRKNEQNLYLTDQLRHFFASL
jgi:cephalosporin-C deacetylase